MLLTVDIGNTGITLGVFDKDILKETFRTSSDINLSESDYKKQFEDVLKKYPVDSCIIASVFSELNSKVKNSLDSIFNINSVLLSNDMPLGFNLNVDAPQEVGADRIANAAAARLLYTPPVIVADAGTATTLDIIDGNGDFIGGVIMPGVAMQLEALNKNTSKLPKVEAENTLKAIGSNTRSSILSGVILGHAYGIKGLIEKCKEELGKSPYIVATGGYSGFVSQYIDFDEINPNLTLFGLKFLYERICLYKM